MYFSTNNSSTEAWQDDVVGDDALTTATEHSSVPSDGGDVRPSNICDSAHSSGIDNVPSASGDTSTSVDVPKPKRLLSIKEKDEFAALFGEASDEEVDPQLEISSGGKESDEDVVEVETARKPEKPVIDLTAETSSDDECSSHKKAKAQSIELRKNSEKSHSSKHKHKHKSRSRNKSGERSKKIDKTRSDQCQDLVEPPSERCERVEEETPIIVSSTSDADQCKELFEMFQRGEFPDNITADDVIEVSVFTTSCLCLLLLIIY